MKKLNHPHRMNTWLKTAALVCSVFTISPSALAQGGWEKTYNLIPDQVAYGSVKKVVQTQDQGYAGLMNLDSSQVVVLKTDADGELQWVKVIPNSYLLSNANSIFHTADGGYLIAGDAVVDNWQERQALVIRLDAAGNVLWNKTFTDTGQESLSDIVELPDGTLHACGFTGWALQSSKTYTLRIDADGNLLSQTTLEQPNVGKVLLKLFPAAGGGTLFAGWYVESNPTEADYYLEKRDDAGNVLWSVHGGEVSGVYDAGSLPGGNVAFLSYCTENGQPGFCLTLLDGTNGNLLWAKKFTNAQFNLPSFYSPALAVSNYGRFFIAGTDQNQGIIIHLDQNGNVAWVKNIASVPGLEYKVLQSVAATADLGCIAGGYHQLDISPPAAYLVKLDSNGQLYNNTITGKIFHDKNHDCQFDGADSGFKNRIVKAAGDQTFFGSSDPQGNYTIEVPPGTYTLTAYSPVPFTSYCQNGVPVTLTIPGQSAAVEFADTALLCPLLQVDMFSWTMRRCSQNQYVGKVCNIGTETAYGATLTVQLDPWLDFLSSGLDLIAQSGQSLTFALGDLPAGQCLDFNILFFLQCGAPFGATHCSEAHAYPDSLCLPADPSWDSSSVVLDATCIGDSIVQFRLRNAGTGNMLQPSQLIVIEDHMIMMQDAFQLPAGAQQFITLDANGATYRLEADQSPGHPGNSMPSVTVEGCGFGNGQVISTGYVNMFPMNDADPWTDIDCRQNTDSHDPNQKEAFPEGYQENHLIERSTRLSYLIRFQNTGTDTAFLVIIRDTLSPYLDPTTIRPGAASHPYDFELDGTGVIKFSFPGIMLPDSNVNEPLSHGFVSFRIDQQPGLPNGTLILNSAAIYFDYNAPVITNETFHTIGENFVLVAVNDPASPGAPVISVYPNPFTQTARFSMQGLARQPLWLTVYDASGKVVRKVWSQSGSPEFHRDGLPSGLYFFKIENQDGVVGSGKMVMR